MGRGAALLLSVTLVACGQQAANPPTVTADNVHLEAEDGAIEAAVVTQAVAEPISGGRIIHDAKASGGRAVILLGTNDAVRFKLPGNFTPGRYTVKVRGRGEFYQGWPTVALENDRRRRMSVTTLDTKSYGVRGFGEFDLRPNQEMYFTFLNDAYDGPGRDRNAVVDYLVIEPVRKTPPAVNQPPTVTLKPIRNGVLTSSDAEATLYHVYDNNIILKADASDPDGKIAKVEFYFGLSKIGEDTTAPYSFVYPRNNWGDDNFIGAFTARAVDDQGAVTTSTAQQAGFTYNDPSFYLSGGQATRAVNFGGPSLQIQRYDTRYGGVTFGTGDTAGVTTNGTPTVFPASAPLSPTPEPNRDALVRSALSRQGGLEVNVPVPNASYIAFLWVRAEDATAYDIQMEGQTVARFEPGVAGQWKRLGPIGVRVGDGVLNVASTGTATANFSAIELYETRVPGAGLPSVYFPSDLPRYARAGQPLTLSVNASDPDGTVSKVEFYALNVGTTESFKLGEVTNAPYTFVWQNTPTSGTYNVGVVATDNSGLQSAIARSSDVTFTTDESLLR